jgi:hypothetical protein
MTERWIENLLQMANEAERLDARSVSDGPSLRVGRRMVAWHRWVAPVAGLAAAVLAICVILPIQSHLADRVVVDRAEAGVNICHVPGETRVERVSIDHLVRENSDPAWLLALVRSWNVDCQCLLWDVHTFADGGALADVRPGESLSLDLHAAQSPSVEQVLVLAVAEDRGRLAGATAEDAVELLNCLNSRDIVATGEHDSASYASAVQSCLPQGITVISRPLLASEN